MTEMLTYLKHKERFLANIARIYGKDLDASGCVYRGRRVQVDVICNLHQHEYKATPDSILKGSGCIYCTADRKRLKERRANTIEIKEDEAPVAHNAFIARGKSVYIGA